MSLMKTIFSTAVRKTAKNQTAGRGLLSMGVGLVATRIATRSVPGAIAVGAGLLAKYLWDQKREADDDVNTAQEMVEENPEIAAKIAREKPEVMTDDYDDVELKKEIEDRKARKAVIN